MSATYRKQHDDGFPFYGVFQRIDEPSAAGLYVLESFQTIDGPRTRVCRGGFHDVEEAKEWITRNQDKGGPSQWSKNKK